MLPAVAVLHSFVDVAAALTTIGLASRFMPMQYGSIIQSGSKGFGRNAPVLIGFTILYSIVAGLVYLALKEVTLVIANSDSPSWTLLISSLALVVLKVLVHLIGSLALINGGLMAARGQTFPFARLFSETQQIFNLLGLHVFAAVAILAGLLAFGIPGIYLSVGYWLAAFVLVDRKLSFLDAMADSRRMITPRWFDVAVLLIVVACIAGVGTLALGFGLLVTAPLAVCIAAAAYLSLSGS